MVVQTGNLFFSRVALLTISYLMDGCSTLLAEIPVETGSAGVVTQRIVTISEPRLNAIGMNVQNQYLELLSSPALFSAFGSICIAA